MKSDENWLHPDDIKELEMVNKHHLFAVKIGLDDITAMEMVNKHHLSAAKSLEWEMGSPDWENTYKELYSVRDDPRRKCARVDEPTFWEFQKKCYHTLLARYVIAEDWVKQRKAREEIKERFGIVDKYMLNELIPDLMKGSEEWIISMRKSFSEAVRSAFQNEQKNRGPSNNRRNPSRPNSY